MEFKYAAVFVVGIILCLATALLGFLYKPKQKGEASVKLANTDLLLENEYFKKQLIKYYVLRAVLVISVAVMILATAILLARPYYQKKIREQKYNRDIIICLDISSSVDELNLKLVNELQDTVRELSGERIGIVTFNTTPITLSPLTDDYEYTIKQLENIHTAIKSQTGNLTIHGKDWIYWNEYLYGGTLVGNEIRGSSLIGDGLMGGLFAFPEDDKDRTKIIIFATDNDVSGECYVNLPEAADYCKENNVTVYGIGTKYMYSNDLKEMRDACEKTGGKFFLEENSSTFHEIVDEIELASENLTEGKTIIKYIETPEKYFTLLIVSLLVYIIVSILLKRSKLLWVVCQVAMIVLLVFVYAFAIAKAHQFSKGPDLLVKKKSNLNVVFVVDDTISMLADDMTSSGGDNTRLSRAKEDICSIVDTLEGAQFSVISFNNNAMLLAPYSQDTGHVKNAVSSIYPIGSLYAKGSSLDTPKELMLETLKSVKSDPKQKTAVFYISDGEITSEEGTLTSFSELSEYIDGGAVMGYGTKDGGTMSIRDYYTGEYMTIEDTSDWPFKDAVSVIDEDNLKQIADDISVKYLNMNNDSLDGVLNDLKKKINTSEEVEKTDSSDDLIKPPKYYGFYFLIPFAALLFINAAYVIKKK